MEQDLLNADMLWCWHPPQAPRQEQTKQWAPSSDDAWLAYIPDSVEPGRMLHPYETSAIKDSNEWDKQKDRLNNGEDHDSDYERDVYLTILTRRGLASRANRM